MLIKRRPEHSGAEDVRRLLPDNRGMALLLVLWIMTLLSIIAMEFSRTSRTEVVAIRNYRDVTQAHFIARAGMEAALFRLLSGKPLPVEMGSQWQSVWKNIGEGAPWPQSVYLPPVSVGDGEFRLRIQRESGRINLNRAGDRLLIPAFMGLGADRETAEIIAASIQDWRDQDHNQLLKGAESKYYLSLDPPRVVKNANFDSVRELGMLRGIVDGRFPVSAFGDGVTWTLLEEIFTVFPKKKEKDPLAEGVEKPILTEAERGALSDYDRITFAAAPASLLAILAGGGAEMEARLMELRKKGNLKEVADLPRQMPQAGRGLGRFITDKFGQEMRIQVIGQINGVNSGQEVILHLPLKKNQDPDILVWNETATLSIPGPDGSGAY